MIRSISISAEGAVNSETLFHNLQNGQVVSGTYSGGEIVSGQLIAACNAQGELDMRYQHMNHKGQLLTGTCYSVPEILSFGKIRLHETWRWTGSKQGYGTSIIKETV